MGVHTDRMAVQWALAVAFLFGVCSTSLAQTFSTGSVSGQVRDYTGGALPGVTVVLVGPDLDRRVVTDSYGTFFFSAPPAVYSVKATLSGFDSLELRGIRLEAGRHVDLPITLQLGCVTPDLHIDDGLAAAVKR